MERSSSPGFSPYGAGLGPPAPDEVRDQLARILTSPEFNAPARVRRFLSYVVDELLAGRGHRIKAYSIAVSVFARNADFDIHNDPVVRIEAGRLRRALERYYLTAGSIDPIIIDVPKGAYVPRIERRADESEEPPSTENSTISLVAPRPAGTRTIRVWEQGRLVAFGAILALALASVAAFGVVEYQQQTVASQASASPDSPTLIVKPFANLSIGEESSLYAAGITDELLSQLARFKELTVYGRETSRSLSSDHSAAEIGLHAGGGYLIEGSIRIFERHLRVTTRLLDRATSQIRWAQTYDRDLNASRGLNIEEDIATNIAIAVAQPYGAIFKPAPRLANSRTPHNLNVHQCILQFYYYRSMVNEVEHAHALNCMEKITVRYPQFATGWAMLSHLYLDEDRFDLNRRVGGPSAKLRAREAADQAVRLDPSNVRALQALMTVLFFNQEPAKALLLGERALALNPNDTELLGELGARVAQAGDWKRGEEMMERALSKNPGLSNRYAGLVAQAAYMQGNSEKAVQWIRHADLKSFSINHFVAALIFSAAGLDAESAASRAEFLRQRPRFFVNFDAELSMRNFNARDRAILIEGAKQAGFPVDAATAYR